ncbi:hypothetical protein N798_02875 [Knoellia flava TL1]|uniref:Lipoprotein n=2 Tax=Knoellia flava TaxID=913969 RepID=A0A8H9FPW2_9MICO|nr:hypothetical protein [Knoellia flava]KGN35461.1 hypothetical protein N798_02875 [Knoellia flava TL1]GGB69114.1 hypothetical protein GCM10011314_05490 [Knoellia flava]
MTVQGRLARQVAAAVAVALIAAGCSGGGDGGGSDDGTGTSDTPREAKPADTTGPIKDAALAAGSVAVTRTVRPGDAGDRITQEEIEVELTEPPSGRVLHVGEEIWTLDVVDGIGYLKDQSERKSANRWQRLSAAETTERLEDVTLDGLLGVIDWASRITKTEKATVAGTAATCHSLTLGPGATAGDGDGPTPQSARICVDGDRRPLELVVTADDEVTTSTFTSWGLAVEALAPPPALVDGD